MFDKIKLEVILLNRYMIGGESLVTKLVII